MSSKKVLILVLSSDFPPYDKMIQTSQDTWDSIEVEGCETIFYCSTRDGLNKQHTGKIMRFDVGNELFDMGRKNLLMFEWALKNKYFDYVARVNASCYVNKKELIKHIQELPENNYVAGLKVVQEDNPIWLWGGGQFIFSKDVIKKIVENKLLLNHLVMEDRGISELITKLAIPFTDGKACSIDRGDNGWKCIAYGTESYEFINFSEIKKRGQYFYRVKYDSDRDMDKFIMEQLHQVLK